MSATATTNALSAHERQRLMRSTRKLGAVLGTTPQLEFQPFQKPLFNENLIDLSHDPIPASSRAATPSSRRNQVLMSLKALEATDDAQSPLVLRVQAMPSQRRSSVSSYVARRFSSVREPRSPSAPSTPASFEEWEDEEKSAESRRRRKMAKLARTLGENVPPELVFPSHASNPSASSSQPSLAEQKRNRRRSRSVSSLTNPSAAPLESPHDDATLRSSEDTVVASEEEHEKPGFFSLVRTTSLQAAKPALSRMHLFAAQRPSLDDYTPPIEPILEHHGAGRRKEREWSGEWNRDDIEDVRAALRGLKSR